jgi:hypothetical protein
MENENPVWPLVNNEDDPTQTPLAGGGTFQHVPKQVLWWKPQSPLPWVVKQAKEKGALSTQSDPDKCVDVSGQRQQEHACETF